MATLWSQSRLNKAKYYPVAQWCNISLNSFLLTFPPQGATTQINNLITGKIKI